jgi:exopolysaccharide biosynthesis WecB/TagA/CpsF family protein
MLYIKHWSLRIVGAALHILFGFGSKENRVRASQRIYKHNKVRILNLLIDNISMPELLQDMKSGVVITPNVDHVMKLQKDPEFFNIYSLAEYKICDSQILLYASRFLNTPLKEKISGSDLFPAFCKFHQDNESIRIFLLGADTGVAEKAKNSINSRIGKNIIVEAYSPSWGFENNEQECLKIIQNINQSQATVLAVGVGAPKQEKWIYKYKDKLSNVKIFLAIGATIDFEAGVVKRAPKWMSNLGLEWLHRLISEPKRLWKRYIVDDLPFLWLILKQKFGLYKAPCFAFYECDSVAKTPNLSLLEEPCCNRKN